MRIVLDTNSLIQSIPERSKFHHVWKSILSGKNILCVSNDILEEYNEILQRLAGQKTADIVLDVILRCPYVELITPYYHFQLISADLDDNKFVDCSIAAKAHFIVTNDHHFDILKQITFPAVDIISLKDFAEMIKKDARR